MRSSQNICDNVQEQFDKAELGLEPLDAENKNLMESHIEGCDNCKKWLSEWELIKLGTQQLPQMEVPAFVLANIMASIESAPSAVPGAVPGAVPSATPVAMPIAIRSDVWLTAAGLSMLLLVSMLYGAEGIEGTASWCLSFIILFAAHQLFRVKGQESEFAR